MTKTNNNTFFMKPKHSKVTTLATTFIIFISLAEGAKAAVIINIDEVGSNVVTSYSGTLNLDGLSLVSFQTETHTGIYPARNFGQVFSIGMGDVNVLTDVYLGTITGDGAIGTAFRFFQADTLSGDHLTLVGSGVLRVPSGYVSGDSLSGTATYLNSSIESLSLTPGAYNYQWGSGVNEDSLTINIVPEPSSALLLGLSALAFVSRRTRNK